MGEKYLRKEEVQKNLPLFSLKKGEAIISMWAIIELFFIMLLAFVIFGWFGISLDQVFSVYGANMFTWLTSALTGFASWIAEITKTAGINIATFLYTTLNSVVTLLASSISNFLLSIFCAISPTC